MDCTLGPSFHSKGPKQATDELWKFEVQKCNMDDIAWQRPQKSAERNQIIILGVETGCKWYCSGESHMTYSWWGMVPGTCKWIPATYELPSEWVILHCSRMSNNSWHSWEADCEAWSSELSATLHLANQQTRTHHCLLHENLSCVGLMSVSWEHRHVSSWKIFPSWYEVGSTCNEAIAGGDNSSFLLKRLEWSRWAYTQKKSLGVWHKTGIAGSPALWIWEHWSWMDAATLLICASDPGQNITCWNCWRRIQLNMLVLSP